MPPVRYPSPTSPKSCKRYQKKLAGSPTIDGHLLFVEGEKQKPDDEASFTNEQHVAKDVLTHWHNNDTTSTAAGVEIGGSSLRMEICIIM